ncbi:MAG: tripartite tricarboxylate transporter TctB family protein [Bryobacteraceae bacterium]
MPEYDHQLASQRALLAHTLIRRGNFWLSLFLLVASVALLVWTTQTPLGKGDRGIVGPWTWPRAVLILLALGTVLDWAAEIRDALRTISRPHDHDLADLALPSGPLQDDTSAYDHQLASCAEGRRLKEPERSDAEPAHEEASETDLGRPSLRLIAALALTVGYVFGVLYVGFLIASFVFLLLFIYLGGFRRPFWALAIAIIGSLGITYLFVRVVYISLPLGYGIFQSIEVAIYHAIGLF